MTAEPSASAVNSPLHPPAENADSAREGGLEEGAAEQTKSVRLKTPSSRKKKTRLPILGRRVFT